MKTFSYILLFLLLAGSVYYFIIRKNDNPFGSKTAAFTIKDTSAVGKLFIADNTGESILIERKNGYWTLNKNYKAMPSMLDMVLGTLNTQLAIEPVSKAAYDNVIKILASRGIKVEVYDKNNSKLTTFYVGGSNATGTGTYMMADGSSTPYLVQTPFFTGDLTPRYSTNFKDWRDRTVFNIPSTAIKSVTVNYEDQFKVNSYKLTRTDIGYKIENDESINTLGPLNVNRARKYMGYFTEIYCEGYLNGVYKMDSSIASTKKMSVLDIEKTDGTHQVLDIYWIPINKRSKNRLTANPDVPDEYDADRLFAIANGGKDTILIQTQMFNRLLRKSYEFHQEDSKKPENQEKHSITVMKK